MYQTHTKQTLVEIILTTIMNMPQDMIDVLILL